MNAYSSIDLPGGGGQGGDLRDLSADLLCAIDQYRAESDNSLLVMTLARLITLLRRHYVAHQRPLPDAALATGHARLAMLMRERAEAMGRMANEVERFAERYESGLTIIDDFAGFRHDARALIGLLAEGMETGGEAMPMPTMPEAKG